MRVVLLEGEDEVVDVFERLVCALSDMLSSMYYSQRWDVCEAHVKKRTGVVGCAASPRSTTRPLCHVSSSGRSYSPYCSKGSKSTIS